MSIIVPETGREIPEGLAFFRQSGDWTFTNHTGDKTVDCNAGTDAGALINADALGSLFDELIKAGLATGSVT